MKFNKIPSISIFVGHFDSLTVGHPFSLPQGQPNSAVKAATLNCPHAHCHRPSKCLGPQLGIFTRPPWPINDLTFAQKILWVPILHPLFFNGSFIPYNLSLLVPSWVIDWDTVFRLGHSPIQAVHNMLCMAWAGECPNLKTVSQSMTHDGSFQFENVWQEKFMELCTVLRWMVFVYNKNECVWQSFHCQHWPELLYNFHGGCGCMINKLWRCIQTF